MSEPSSPFRDPASPHVSSPAAFTPEPYQVFVAAPRPSPRYWIHALLLLLTFFSTLTVGARMQFDFQRGLPAFAASVPVDSAWSDFWNNVFPLAWVMARPARLLLGIPF